MESQYTEMGRRIKLRRKELKIKQSEMAEALNVSNNHISSIETGKQKREYPKVCVNLQTDVR